MNGFKQSILLLVMGLSSLVAAGQNKIELTLKSAQALAISQAPELKVNQAELSLQAERKKEIRSRNLPKVTVNADARNNFQLATLLFPLPSGVGGSNGELTPVQTGTRYNFTASAEATQNIYDPAISADKRIADAQVGLAKAQQVQSESNIKYNVAKAYYAILLNKEKLDLTTADLLRKVTLHLDAKAKVLQQQAIPTDTLKTGLNVRNAEVAKTQAMNTLKLAYDNLKSQIGLEQAVEVVVKDKLQQMTMTESYTAPSDSSTYRDSPDYLIEQAQLSINDAQLQKISASYYPTLTAYGYYGAQAFRTELDFLSTNGRWFPVGYLGIRASWTLFDGFAKQSQATQQKIAALKFKANQETIRKNLSYQRTSAQTARNNSVKNYLYQLESRKVAMTLYDQARLRVRQGQALQAEVTEAEYSLKQTEDLYLQAVYDYLIAELDYSKATSKL